MITPELEKTIKDSLKELMKVHSIEFVKGIEQLFRNETGHFKSSLFPITWGAGMEAFAPEFPYGWTRLNIFWLDNKDYQPIGIHKMIENTSELQQSRGERKFIVFENLTASMMSVAKDIELIGGFGAWFDNNKADQTAYEQTLNSIIPHYCNEIILEIK